MTEEDFERAYGILHNTAESIDDEDTAEELERIGRGIMELRES